MSFPSTHMLIGAGLAELAWSAAPTVPRWRAWAVCAVAAALPDVDMLIGYVSGRGFAVHGTFTHSLSAMVLCTLLVTGLAGVRWGLIAGIGYGSHLLVDLMDGRGPTNVTLGWPFSHARSIAIEPVFRTVPVEAGRGGMTLVESIFTGPALRDLLVQTATAVVVFGSLCLLGWIIRRMRDSPSDPVPLPG
ncbi:MAG TPA: metal-dependent hydrolase [Longimicrobiaceae bacterium]|nr:metal-dependent hydrolase [Longimicrobiaceae bacterium]